MSTERPRVPLQSVGGGSRRPGFFVLAAALVIALLLLKPWARPSAPPSPGAASPSATVSGEPSTAPSGRPTSAPFADDAAALTCWSRQAWLAVSLERHDELEVRSWRAVTPVVAARPRDPRIPVLRLVADSVIAIGYCAPQRSDGRPDERRLSVWRDRGRAGLERVRGLQPLEPNAGSGAAVYRPRSGTWPSGRYFLQVPDPERSGRSVWFALEVRTRAGSGGDRSSPRP